MDPITHTLVGVGLGNAFFRRRSGPPATVVLALASNLPDLDGIVMLTMGQAGVVMRRTFGHSLLLLPIWVVLLAGLLGWFVPRIRFPARVGLVALGALFHLFFDLVNSFGVVLLWPLSDWRPELAIVFIVDLVLAGLLAAPLLLALSRRFRARIVPFSRGAVALAALYVALCGAARVRAEGILAREAETLRPRPEFSYVFPEPLGPQHWRGVLRQDGTYRIYLVDPIKGRAELRREVSTAGDSPAVRRVRGSPWGRRLENFFKAAIGTTFAHRDDLRR